MKGYFSVLCLCILFPLSLGQSGRDLFNTIGDIFGVHVEDCQYTGCDSFPKCPYGRDSLMKIRADCPGFKEKSYCCRPGRTPYCLHVPCTKDPGCPIGYRELDRDRKNCPSFNQKIFCCRNESPIPCFEIPCHSRIMDPRNCPEDYEEVQKTGSGCPGTHERKRCCLRGQENYVSRENVNTNENYGHGPAVIPKNSETVSETQVMRFDNGTTITITKSQTMTKGGWLAGSGSEERGYIFPTILMVAGILLKVIY